MPAMEVSATEPITNGTTNGDADDLAEVIPGGARNDKSSEVSNRLTVK